MICSAMKKPREVDLLAAFTILLSATIAYLGRNVLNPDGVSYLDLADAMRRGTGRISSRVTGRPSIRSSLESSAS